MPPCLRIPRDLYWNSYSETLSFQRSMKYCYLYSFQNISLIYFFFYCTQLYFSMVCSWCHIQLLSFQNYTKSLVQKIVVNSKFHPCLGSVSVLEDNISLTWPKFQGCILFDGLESSLNWLCCLEWKFQYYNYTF